MNNPAPSLYASLQEQIRSSHLLPWLVLAVGLLVTHQLWKNEQKHAAEVLQADFDSHVRDARSRVELRMETYEQVMRGVDGLFAHANLVERDEFRNYIARLHLKENYPGIQGIRFIPVVPQAAKDRHIAAIRKEGFPAYTIWPEGKRDFYAPVMFVEPDDERNQAVFGYDMLSDRDYPRAGEVAGMRRAAMEQARDTGQATLSGKVRLLFETDQDNQAGFLMVLPVYRHDAPHETVAERRANIVGWISSVFRMGDLMMGILSDHVNEFDIDIFDGETISNNSMMHDPDHGGVFRDSTARFQNAQPLDIAGRKWTLQVISKPDFDAMLDKEKSQLIGVGGIVTSVLIALLTWLLVHGRALALQTAHRMNRELIEREKGLRLAATVFKTVDEAVMVTSPDNRIIAVNPSFTRITGYSADEVIGRNPRMLSSGKHPPEFFREMLERLTATGCWQGEIWNRRKNGELFIEWLSINLVYDEEKGHPTHHVAVFSDISERKAAEERIQHMAHYDLLTNLPNRALLIDRLQQALAKARRDKAHMALMFLDLDKFKPVNDALGHHVGDLLLKEVAKRLQYCVRGSDTVSRMGGDEFVVLLPTVEETQDAMIVAEKILHSLNQTFELAGHDLHISSSIGVAVYPEHGSDEEMLLKNADTAMYLAKECGRNNVQIYHPVMQEDGGESVLSDNLLSSQ